MGALQIETDSMQTEQSLALQPLSRHKDRGAAFQLITAQVVFVHRDCSEFQIRLGSVCCACILLSCSSIRSCSTSTRSLIHLAYAVKGVCGASTCCECLACRMVCILCQCVLVNNCLTMSESNPIRLRRECVHFTGRVYMPSNASKVQRARDEAYVGTAAV